MKKSIESFLFNRVNTLNLVHVLLLLIAFTFSMPVLYASTDIWVRPYEIKFDYQPGHSDDALTIKDDDGNILAKPEWRYSPSRSNNVAYIKNQSGHNIMVRFDSNCDKMHLVINLNVTTGTGAGEVCNQVVMNYEAMDWVELSLEGNIPDFIGKHSYSWEWEVYAITNETGYCSALSTHMTSHTFYSLLDTPQSPMSQPWTSVLDYACDWAENQSTLADAVEKITEGIYYDLGDLDGDIDYDYGSPYSPNYNTFKLSCFFDSIASYSNIKVNCTDCANLVSIFCSAIGSQTYTKRIWTKEQDRDNMIETDLINPIGNTKSWDFYYWFYHQYAWIADLADDASLRCDSTGISEVPANMNQTIYDSLVIYYYPAVDSTILNTQIVE